MTTTVLRWLLAPRTSWAAWKLARSSDGSLAFDTAWRTAGVRFHPDEAPY